MHRGQKKDLRLWRRAADLGNCTKVASMMALLGALVIGLSCSRPPQAESAAPNSVSTTVADSGGRAPGEGVNFAEDIQPILSDRCYRCHGPDESSREMDLRLDTREGALAVIEPGQPETSELFLRISAEDEDERMPPIESHLSLSSQEIELIRQWIQEGAKWDQHWSFKALAQQVPVPTIASTDPAQDPSWKWAKDEIDAFVLKSLKDQGLTPAPRADKAALLRRLSFDLTGLPPSLQELDQFLADQSPGAYERAVDQLLASPRFGERLAADWLDLARYADSYGYQEDFHRNVWPYRDWVVQAFNQNLPYDQFVTWQLAGDLLPNATREQQLATTFNRLHGQTNEGGSIEEEFRISYVSDRVNTFGTAFLGLTFECTRCHDHKFDPLTQKDYYSLSAFFNNIEESGLYSYFTDAVPTPALDLPTPQQEEQLTKLENQVREIEARLRVAPMLKREAFDAWLAVKGRGGDSTRLSNEDDINGRIAYFPMQAAQGSGKNKHRNTVKNQVRRQADGEVVESPEFVTGPTLAGGKSTSALRLHGENGFSTKLGSEFDRHDAFSYALWIRLPGDFDAKKEPRAVILHRSKAWTDSASQGYELLLENGKLSAALNHFAPGNAIKIRSEESLVPGQWTHITVTYDGSSRADGLRLYIDGEASPSNVIQDSLNRSIRWAHLNGEGEKYKEEATPLVLGYRFRDRGFKGGEVAELQLFDRQLSDPEVLLLTEDLSFTDLQKRGMGEEELRQYFLSNLDDDYQQALLELKAARKARDRQQDEIMQVMVMREREGVRETHRLDRGAYDAKAEVVQRQTPAALPPMDPAAPKDRLGLAKWLFAPDHPLMARVTVNRFWQNLFGRGLVVTSENFGRQGQAASHPELLDWLAREFVNSKWDVKKLVKKMVMSAAYQQSTTCSVDARKRDPSNKWLSCSRRDRLSAEMIRDQALFVSGLLVEKQGGPPVKPYQPPGLWKEKGSRVYERQPGEGSHRRSLYTYWRRSSPPPAMLTFDAAKRDVCISRRESTETPLQSLVLLNGPQYIEAARALAQRSMQQHPDKIESQIQVLFRALTSRHPDEAELELLKSMFDEQGRAFRSAKDARKFLSIGDLKIDRNLSVGHLAALTVVAQAVMNFDAAVTRP